VITFAVPFHRGRHLLERALASVVAQSSPEWRLVVCDEGVEDGAEPAVAALGDARARYARNERPLGLAGNWNRCLEQAETDLVCILHGDDELAPHYVRLMTDAARDDPDAAAFFCDAEIVDEQGRPCWSLPDAVKEWVRPGPPGRVDLAGEPGLAALLKGNFIMCPTLCYRVPLRAGARFDARWGFVPDLDLETRLLMSGGRLVGLASKAYRYRRHPGSQTHVLTRGLERFEEELRFYDEVGRQAEALGWSRAAEVARRRSMVQLNLAYCALRDLAGLRPAAAARKARLLVRTVARRVRSG
jgi:glycosyltransferase involved in cell wall biosynthesis